MANIVNQYGQVKVGVRQRIAEAASTLWNSIYSVFNADSAGSSSLKTSLYAAYNGESNANDSFGSNNGTAQGGLTYTTGKIGNAFQFNGSNSYVSLPNDSYNNLTGDFSISFWVNYSSLSGAQGIFSDFTYNGTNFWGIGIIALGNSLRFSLFNGSSTQFTLDILSGQAMITNTWYHYTITRKASTGSKIYRNGTLLVSDTNTVNPVYNSGNIRPAIGAYNYGPLFSNLVQYYMSNGSKIDALTVWNKELTQSEITELYNSGNGAQYIGDNFYKPTTNDALNTYNGTAQGGLTYGVGKVGTAFQFNGTNSYVGLPDNSLNSLNGSFSISAWFKTASSIQNVDNYILNNASANSWFNNPNGFDLDQYGNQIYFSIFNNTNTYTTLNAGYVFQPNTWYHVVATKLINGNMNVYLNGTLLGTKVTTVNPTYLATVSKPCIGALNIPARVPSVGYQAQNGFQVDALTIWNKELSASEVTELYNSGNGKQYPN